MSQSEIVTLLLAFYGALLSTVLAVRELTKDRRQVKITCNYALALPPGSNKTLSFISITVVNTGHRPIQIKQAGILLSNGSSIIQLENRLGVISLPKKLEDGESLSIMFDEDKIDKEIKKQRSNNIRLKKVFVSDVEGNIYTIRLPKFLKEKN